MPQNRLTRITPKLNMSECSCADAVDGPDDGAWWWLPADVDSTALALPPGTVAERLSSGAAHASSAALMGEPELPPRRGVGIMAAAVP